MGSISRELVEVPVALYMSSGRCRVAPVFAYGAARRMMSLLLTLKHIFQKNAIEFETRATSNEQRDTSNEQRR